MQEGVRSPGYKEAGATVCKPFAELEKRTPALQSEDDGPGREYETPRAPYGSGASEPAALTIQATPLLVRRTNRCPLV
jgi:hypothetical protein